MPHMKEKLVEMLKDTRANAAWHLWGYEESVDHLIANGVTIQRWIPVTERLPDLHTTVLVYDQESKRDLFWYDENGFNVVDEYGCTYPVKTVTHWMPLPEAPKGQ